MVKLLTKSKADVEARDKSGWRPLAYAAYGGQLTAAHALVKTCGADVEIVDKVRPLVGQSVGQSCTT